MDKRAIIVLWALHAVLLILAATNFTSVSWLWSGSGVNFSYFQFAQANGWGYQYVSEYSLMQTLCYVLAYGLGVVLFAAIWRRKRSWPVGFAAILCILGTFSFAIESTHWVFQHHFSLIVSAPILVLILWLVIGVRMVKAASAVHQPIENKQYSN